MAIYLVKLFLLKLILLGANTFLYIENDLTSSTKVIGAYSCYNLNHLNHTLKFYRTLY